VLKPQPGGTSISLHGELDGVGLIAIGYKYNKSCVLHFIMSENAGSTYNGDPYQMKFPDESYMSHIVSLKLLLEIVSLKLLLPVFTAPVISPVYNVLDPRPLQKKLDKPRKFEIAIERIREIISLQGMLELGLHVFVCTVATSLYTNYKKVPVIT
jgi:hypothetical protein